VGQVVDGVVVVLKKRYERVAHTSQENGKQTVEVHIVQHSNGVIIVELVIDMVFFV